MNIYLLQAVGKWLSLIIVSTASLFGLINTDEQETVVSNQNESKNLNCLLYTSPSPRDA